MKTTPADAGGGNRSGKGLAMSTIWGALKAVGRGVARLIALIRDGESDIRETYPEHYHPTGEQTATQASVTMSFTGLGSA